MRMRYTPEGEEPRVFEFAPEKLTFAEGEAIEKVTGMTFGEWAEAMEKGSMTALRAAVWVLRKRNGEPELRYRDTADIPFGWISAEADPEDETEDDAGDEDDDGEGDGLPKDEADLAAVLPLAAGD